MKMLIAKLPTGMFYLLLCFIIAACSKSQPDIELLADDAVILAFGDSLTEGYGSKKSFNYPSVLAELSGMKVINEGLSGEISKDGLRRLPALLDKHNPALLILCHGGNDLLRKLDKNQMRENLKEMVRTAQARGINVVMIGTPEPGIFLSSAPMYQEIADEFNVPIEMDVLAEVLGDASLKSDHIHPNESGYRKVAEGVYRLLLDVGAF